jgi:hypothetical protein
VFERFCFSAVTYFPTLARESFGARTFARSNTLSWIGHRRDVVPISDSDMCLDRVGKWLEHCQSKHAACLDDDDRVALPKRLIDVRDLGRPRLCETSGLPANDTSYATLSHCWGRWGMQNLCRTQTHTLEKYLVCIPWDEVPKTFRDAMTVTHRLGLPYLWIDSICIVQDDLNDWAEESAKMSHIYTDAVFTIAASAAENAMEGFLGPRQRREAKINPTAKNSLPLSIRQDIHLIPSTNKPIPLLNERGWVFQERLLSRRVLHFEKEEMIWECRTA